MLEITRDLLLLTTITGSYPKPNWYTQGPHGRPFKPEAPIRAADPCLAMPQTPGTLAAR